MRINRLEVAGFGPYKSTQVVDFDAFASDGIFLIAGRTGAGKSSILDAICFALYNAVPRYDGTDKQLRSHHAGIEEPSSVTLEFTVGGERYRVVRSPEFERPAKRGGGTTTQKAEAQLFAWREGQWEGLAARAVDVAHELDSILGLRKHQFLQVILLAQNRFQDFLLARNDERQAVLQALFGTHRFAEYERRLTDRASALAARLADSEAQRVRDSERAMQVAGVEVGDDLAEGLAALAAELEAATVSVAQARSTADAAGASLAELTERAERQDRRHRAEEALAVVEAERGSIASDAETLARASRAALVEAHLAAAERAERAAEAADAAELAEWNRFAPFEHAGIDLEAQLDADRGSLGALEQALEEERTFPGLVAAVSAAQGEVTRLAAALERATEREATLPESLAALTETLEAARADAATLPAAEETLARLQQQRASAEEAERLGAELQEAREREHAAAEVDVQASAAVRDLLAAQLHGRAAVLAAALVPGEPCAVCGSTEHPAPALPADDAVTDEDVTHATQAADQARAQLAAAHATVADATARHAAALTAAGTVTAEEVADARQRRDAAQESAKRAEELGREREALLNEQRTLAAERNALQEQLATSRAVEATARERHDGCVERLERQRGDHASVAERAQALREAIAAGTALQAAIAAARQARTAVAEATASRDAALAEHDFPDAATASGSLLPAADRARLETRIIDHGQREAIARATLAELPEAAEVGADELAAARAAAQDAADVLAACTEQRGSVAQRHADYEELLAAVRGREEATAALRQEYAPLKELAAAVKGDNASRMRLETYVLAAQLEQIVSAANARLTTMTSGRYELQHDDGVQYRRTQSGLGVVVLDQHTGRTRSPQSLSGGETFLASLALALGLADVVTAQSGGVSLDTLFVDEGFGSLDAETLEIAMGTLDSLRQGGRTIGLISHVEAMKEQIPAKLEIRVEPGGWSTIEQEN